ncbi:MAG: DUF1330 domain-containing protein [Erythrobacter sp.]
MRFIWSIFPVLLIAQSPVLAEQVHDLAASQTDFSSSEENSISPPAYVIAEIDVHDAVSYEAYKSEAAQIITKYGGRYLVRGGSTETIEGQSPQGRFIILEFPSMTAAKAFLESDEYRPVAEIRYKSATSRLTLTEGIAP